MQSRTSSSITSIRILLAASVLSAFSLVVAGLRLPFLATLLTLPVALLAAYAVVRAWVGMPPTITGNVLEKRYGDLRYQLVAMPINHFGERLRWCMDLLAVPYEETDVGGILSIFLRGRTVPWLVDRQSRSVIGNSEEALWYLSAVHVPTIDGPGKRAAEALLHRDARTMAWEDQLNAIGHAVQGWVYFYFLGPSGEREHCLRMWGGLEPHVPTWQRWILRAGYPVLRQGMRKAFNLGNLAQHEKRRAILDRAIRDVEAALTQSGGPFLFGDSLSYVDVSVCALMGPLMHTEVLPLWARGRFTSLMPLVDSPTWPEPLTRFAEELTARPFGQYILRTYRDHRDQALVPNPPRPKSRKPYVDVLPVD